MKRIILASNSPRRRELLKQLGLIFDVLPSNASEGKISPYDPVNGVIRAAQIKAEDVVFRAKGDTIIIAADTVVLIDDMVLGKPQDKEDARNMLRRLNGRAHQVITGFTVMERVTGKRRTGYETTKVYFRKLDEEEIRAYVESGEPMDKAGSYGIQGLGSSLVNRIEGCYFNVVGLPVSSLCEVLKDFGVNPLLGK